MYYRRLYLPFVVSLLLLNSFIFTGCNNNVDAQNNGTVIATEFLPVVGLPFSSLKDDGSGEFVSGSSTIDAFLLEDGNLLARGLIKGASLNPSGAEVALQVQISQSTCHVLEMEIGPPLGLSQPIIVVSHEASRNDLSHRELCQISQAIESDDQSSLVDLLNQESTLDPPTGGPRPPLCTWYDALACETAEMTCAALCITNDPNPNRAAQCRTCLRIAGAAGCCTCNNLCGDFI